MLRSNADTLRRAECLLAETRAALLGGDLQALPVCCERVRTLVDEITPATLSRDQIVRLRQIAAANARLIVAARDGILAVRDRLLAARQLAQGLTTYDQSGAGRTLRIGSPDHERRI